MAEESTSPRDAKGEASIGGYAELARKWSGRSTNLLASGLVVVVAIALVRYVAPWWKQEQPPSSSADVAETVGQGIATDDPQGVLSGFGDLTHSFRQARFAGDRNDATCHLRQLCREFVALRKAVERRIGPAEMRMLQGLDVLAPVQQEEGQWRMYQLDGPAPIVAVVAWTAVEKDETQLGQRDLPATGVLCWGIAIPSANEQWTLFVYPGGGDQDLTFPLFSQSELPAGTVRTMSLRSDNGAAMLAFKGSVDVAACRRHFDRWSARTNTPAVAPWRKLGKQWLARFADPRVGWVEVHLFEDDGRLTGGLLSISSHTDAR